MNFLDNSSIIIISRSNGKLSSATTGGATNPLFSTDEWIRKKKLTQSKIRYLVFIRWWGGFNEKNNTNIMSLLK